MRIVRSPAPFLKSLVSAIDYQLRQIWFIRFLCGGVWFKIGGVWDQCDIMMICLDGSYILKWRDVSFHETNLMVQDLKDFR